MHAVDFLDLPLVWTFTTKNATFVVRKYGDPFLGSGQFYVRNLLLQCWLFNKTSCSCLRSRTVLDVLQCELFFGCVVELSECVCGGGEGGSGYAAEF